MHSMREPTGNLACRLMKQGGHAHELARSRIIIGIKKNSPAKPQASPRPGILSEHPPTLSFKEKDGVSVLGQLWTTRLLPALKEAYRLDGHHPWAASGSQISCVQPCRRAPDGSDGPLLRGEGDSGKEIARPTFVAQSVVQHVLSAAA